MDYLRDKFNEHKKDISFLPNIDELRDDCKVWLTTILEKYDPNRGSKAFSYFSVITKNWFIHKVKQRAKRAKREVDYEDALKELSFEQIVYYNPYHENKEKQEFWELLELEMDGWGTDDMNDNEKTAVLDLLRTVRIGIVVMAICAGSVGVNELTGVI